MTRLKRYYVERCRRPGDPAPLPGQFSPLVTRIAGPFATIREAIDAGDAILPPHIYRYYVEQEVRP